MQQQTEILLKKLEGKQTIDTIAEALHMRKTSALNIIAKLKKKRYLKTSGGGRQKRIYTIATKTFDEENGMFAVINKYAKTKIIAPYRHVVYGKYGPEDAIIDAILLKDIRTLQAALWLFNHLKDWKQLSERAKIMHCETIVGALYDFSRKTIKTRKMPEHIYGSLLRRRTAQKLFIIRNLQTDDAEIKEIEKRWNVSIPFSEKEREEMR